MKKNEKVYFKIVAENQNTQEDKRVLDVTIRIAMELGWIDKVRILLNAYDEDENSISMNHVENDEEYAYFHTNVQLNYGLYYYHFDLEINGDKYEIRRIGKTQEACITHCKDLLVWKYDVGFSVPDWARSGTMYHIFVDRYRHSNDVPMITMKARNIHKDWNEKPVIKENSEGLWNVDFFGGNLDGIRETLSYIKRLGCSIIYISPPCYSQSNHRYDTSDYEKIDPYAGTYDSLRKLCSAAHRKGMKVIIDAVFNHVGNDSKYFNEYHNFDTVGAYESKESPYYQYFKKDKNGQFVFWWGQKNLPVCDGNCIEWRNYICGIGGVIDKWFQVGIDALRLDVADELSDEFIQEIRKAVLRNKKDGYIVGEVWKNPMRMKRQYLKGAKGMDSVMNYLLSDALIRYVKFGDTNKINDVFYQILMEYPETAIFTLMNFTSTHDITRIIDIFGREVFKTNGEWVWDLQDNCDPSVIQKLKGKEYLKAKKLFKVYLTILTFFPGIVTIFYGDEAGLQGLGNLLNRSTYPWGRRDKDLVKFVRDILKLRNSLKFLKYANVTDYEITTKTIFLERGEDEESILVVVNRSDETVILNTSKEYEMAETIYATYNSTKAKLEPYGAIILKK